MRRKEAITSTEYHSANITRRHCVSKVPQIFDLTGKITPITATMKLDLHTQRGCKEVLAGMACYLMNDNLYGYLILK